MLTAYYLNWKEEILLGKHSTYPSKVLFPKQKAFALECFRGIYWEVARQEVVAVSDYFNAETLLRSLRHKKRAFLF